MAPFNLHGLNVVRPVQPDSQDLAVPSPDFSAHLDLWTNLAFESDEPLTSSKRKLTDEDDEDEDDNDASPTLSLPSQNIALPTAPSSSAPNVPLDISALLAGFGLDPLLMPTVPPVPVQQSVPQQAYPVPSLAQLLALHATYTGSYTAPPPSATPVPSLSVTSSSNPPKRSRTQKSPSADNTDTPSVPPEEPTQPDTTLSAAEDKRRRNTAASARFRLKKKEREAALERRAKELEDRVVELERECEGLRRENGWLKGLVVGVTGAGAAQHQQASAK